MEGVWEESAAPGGGDTGCSDCVEGPVAADVDATSVSPGYAGDSSSLAREKPNQDDRAGVDLDARMVFCGSELGNGTASFGKASVDPSSSFGSFVETAGSDEGTDD